MLNAIYGSRIYKGSLDQETILAAVKDPINSELLVQLSKYVDPESIQVSEEEKIAEDVEEASSEEVEEDSEDSTYVEETSDEVLDTEEVEEEQEVVDQSFSDEAEESSSSFELSKEEVEASAPGVSRVFRKKNETWIAYNDDVNLDNILWDVVEDVSSASNGALKFNRVARSENSIVFVDDSMHSEERVSNEF